MNTFQRYLVDEFAEDYEERRLTRRDALKLIASVTGSLIVAEFDSLELAQQWAETDPYVAAGVYRDVTVKPFKWVLP